jgi:hypothetical protein
MAAQAADRPTKSGNFSASVNWLEYLDNRVSELSAASDWLDDSELALQRCRRFIMARFPGLPSMFDQSVFCRELSQGERLIKDSKHGDRIFRGLNLVQRNQLAGLLLDVMDALRFRTGHQESSRKLQELATEGDRRTRMLFRKVSGIRRELEALRTYAERLHPLLGLKYVRAAELGLRAFNNLKEDPSAGESYRWLRSQHPTLEEDPRQLGMVELYCFFRYECRCGRPDSEVRVGMLANDFLASPMKYVPKYGGAESQGCPAVRIAVSRWSSVHN